MAAGRVVGYGLVETNRLDPRFVPAKGWVYLGQAAELLRDERRASERVQRALRQVLAVLRGPG